MRVKARDAKTPEIKTSVILCETFLDVADITLGKGKKLVLFSGRWFEY
jgi:hypothetical protein